MRVYRCGYLATEDILSGGGKIFTCQGHGTPLTAGRAPLMSDRIQAVYKDLALQQLLAVDVSELTSTGREQNGGSLTNGDVGGPRQIFRAPRHRDGEVRYVSTRPGSRRVQ